MTGKEGGATVWLTASRSPYTRREKVRMALWWAVEALLFRPSLHPMHGWRRMLLTLFGARLGEGSTVHAKARVWFPWNLEMGRNSGIGFDVLVYNLDRVVIGDFVTIGHRSQLNTGGHDLSDPAFRLVTQPVTIGSGAFVGTECYVGPGVAIGEMAVIGARSVVTKDMPAGMICFGHPCRAVKPRTRRVEKA
jgi:putative colanic acid biosynthesis acetyltransferase WcaF